MDQGYGANDSARTLYLDGLGDAPPQPPKRKLWGRVKRPFANSSLMKKRYPSGVADKDGVAPRSERFWVATRALGHFIWELIFGGRHFCCCIPTRFGVIVGSCLQFLVAGALSIVLWFEVTTQHDFTFSHFDKVMFTGAGVLETFLFVAAILGFIGAIVRKQLFMVLYCGFLYIHFLANFAVACWITWKINHVTNTDIRVACYNAVKDPQAKDQCKNLVGDTGKLLLIIVWVIIVIELYGVLIATRYTRQLRKEKKHGRQSYMRIGSEGSGAWNRESKTGSRDLNQLEGIHDGKSGQDTPFEKPGFSPSPKSADYSYRNSTATFFPLTPANFPTPGHSPHNEHDDGNGASGGHAGGKHDVEQTV